MNQSLLLYFYMVRHEVGTTSLYLLGEDTAGFAWHVRSQLDMMIVVHDSVDFPVVAVATGVDVRGVQGVLPLKGVILMRALAGGQAKDQEGLLPHPLAVYALLTTPLKDILN